MAQVLSYNDSLSPLSKMKLFYKKLTKNRWRFFNLLTLLAIVLVLPLSVFIVTQQQEIRQHAAGGDVTVSVDLTKPDVVSKMSPGVTYEQHNLDPWGDPTGIASGMQLLQTSSPFQNQHIYGWGGLNPEPSPGVYDWVTLDRRIQLMRDTQAAVKVITLCCAPDWMAGGQPGQTTYPNSAPYGHFADFADLAKLVALRYPDVQYFQVWNEMKGFYNASLNRWDYEGYTQMYNQVYDAIKAVRPDAKIGGPYPAMDSWGDPGAGGWPGRTYSWGTLDKRPMDVITYWLANKHGADFITVDAWNGNKDLSYLVDPYTNTQKFSDIVTWIRTLPNGGATLPIWWAEWYSSARDGSNLDENTSVMAVGMINTLKSGSIVPLIWQPQGDPSGYSFPVGVWTGDAAITADEGKPTPFYYVQKAFKDNFGPGTQTYTVNISDPSMVDALASVSKTLLVNKRNTQTIVSLGDNLVTLAPYQVTVVDTVAGTPVPTTVATATPTPTTTVTTPVTSGFLSDQQGSYVANGWGPIEQNMSVGGNSAGDGKTISLNGVTYQKGLGTNAYAEARYNLAGACNTFTAEVGLDDEVDGQTWLGKTGSVVFQVLADGTKLFDSGIMIPDATTQHVSVDVTGKSQLQLIVTDGGDGDANDHADWANAAVTCGITPTPTPTSGPTPTPTTAATPTPKPTIPLPTIATDTTPPSVSLLSPANGTLLQRNSTVSISASASDNVGVARVEFSVNSSIVCTDTALPYSCSWKVPGKPSTSYTLTAKAYDASGNTSSSSITVKSSK